MIYNYEQLAKDLQTVSHSSKLYKTVKTALLIRGNWKNKKRGKPRSFR